MNKFKEMRCKLNMTLDAAAKGSGLSRPTVHKLENGGSSYDRILYVLENFYKTELKKEEK